MQENRTIVEGRAIYDGAACAKEQQQWERAEQRRHTIEKLEGICSRHSGSMLVCRTPIERCVDREGNIRRNCECACQNRNETLDRLKGGWGVN